MNQLQQGLAVVTEIARLRRIPDLRAREVSSAAIRALLPMPPSDELEAAKQVARVRARMEADRSTVVVDTGETFTIGHLTRKGSKPPRWTRFLYRLERLHGAACVLELGTNAGVSGTALGLALPAGGRLWTLDVNLTDHSKAAFEDAGLGAQVTVVEGYFDDTLDAVLDEAAPVGLAFVDGHHQEEATLSYFERILPNLTSDALVVLDDIHWSAGMESAWQRVCAHESIAWASDLRSVGVVAVNG